MEVYAITLTRKHVTVLRTPKSSPLTLLCPFCSRQGDSPAYELGRMGLFSGACGQWCPHFGNPVKNPKTLYWEITLTCGATTKLETSSLRVEDRND